MKAATAEIERRSVEVQTELIAGGLESDEGKRFLASMPTPAQLMPTLDAAELRAEVEARPAAHSRNDRHRLFDLDWEWRQELRALGLPLDAVNSEDATN